MSGPFLVLLLLLAAALGSHAQVVETKYKDGKHHYKRDVKKDYSYKTTEEYPQHATGPGPKQDSYGGPKKDSYEGNHKQQECHDDCPNPQPPESVADAYMAHYSFVWAKLAQEYASSGDGGDEKQQAPSNHKKKQQRRRAEPKMPMVPGEDTFDPSMTWLKQHASKLAQQQPGASGSEPAAGRGRTRTAGAGGSSSSKAKPAAVGADVAAAAATAAAKNGTTAQIAAVTNPDFLVPTDPEYTERGFEGTYDTAIPTYEALAVGPHPADEDSVLVLHGVKRMWQIFSASRDGKKIDSSVPTKIPPWLISQKMGFNTTATSTMNTAYPRAFFDKVDNRFVLTYGVLHFTYEAEEGDPWSHIVVCVSAGNNPLADWTCWALDARLMVVAPNGYLCDGMGKGSFLAGSPTPSYSVDGIFASIIAFCIKPEGPEVTAFATAVHVFPKKALYGPPPSADSAADFKVWRATYLPAQSWYYSLPARDQVLQFDADPLPGYEVATEVSAPVRPALPQTAQDAADPVIVMGKVNGGLYMSLAKFTGGSWNDMDSRHNAPRIYAAVVRRPDDFRIVPPYTLNDDLELAVIPQPGPADTPALGAGADLLLPYDAGTPGATKFRGLVFIATQDFFGADKARLPSIFWAIVDPSPRLCSPSLESWGLLASADGLALATPIITGRSECGAFLAFSYGGNTTIELNGKRYPAYAGAAKAVVGCEGARGEITVVKRGEGLVTRDTFNPQRWGYYSAWDSLDGMIWTAVPVALDTDLQYGSWISTERC